VGLIAAWRQELLSKGIALRHVAAGKAGLEPLHAISGNPVFFFTIRHNFLTIAVLSGIRHRWTRIRHNRGQGRKPCAQQYIYGLVAMPVDCNP
jgi:hypothetical protein